MFQIRPVVPLWSAGAASCVIVVLVTAGARREMSGSSPGGAGAATPGLRINEVMAHPEPTARNGAGEWVELFNQGPAPIDLHGWCLGDDADPDDRLLPWHPGIAPHLPPGGLALVLDPDTDLETQAFPPDVLLLRPDDASIGNGLRIDGDRLWLTNPAGVRVDSMRWQSRSGPGISWERTGGWGADAEQWRPSRDPGGSTPGEPNSWTPRPGDYRLRWLEPGGVAFESHAPVLLRAILSDRGGSGLGPLQVQAMVIDPLGIEHSLDWRTLPGLAPRDSSMLSWTWYPDQGGSWHALVSGEGANQPRGWDRADTIQVAVRPRPQERVISEALPRPLPGEPEWLEIWAPAGVRAWGGWRIRVRSAAGAGGSARKLTLPAGGAEVVLVVPDSAALQPPLDTGETAPFRVIWPGLRLADAGCSVVLIDPLGAVVDSAVLRPAADLPRGHSYQRWRPDLPGWLPAAWGFSRTPREVTPGWVGAESHGADGDRFPRAGASGPAGLEVEIHHPGPGRVALVWRSPAERLWLEARLYTLAGSQAGVVVPRALVAGAGRLEWEPAATSPPAVAGLYLLVVEGRDPEGGGNGRVSRALGVRP